MRNNHTSAISLSVATVGVAIRLRTAFAYKRCGAHSANYPSGLCTGSHGHKRMVVRKPLDLPPAVAKTFMKDMKAYFDEKDAFTRDQIALRQLHTLRELQGPSEKELRLSDVKRMFMLMKNQSG